MLVREFDKAGIVIYGTNAQGKRALVVPYTEGRFGNDYKYYSLPIGSVDKGETVREAGLRETDEETGISIKRLIGEEAYRNFIAGKPVRVPFDSPGYSGVRVVHVELQPAKYTYLSRVGTHRGCGLYGIEVEGIEHLAPFLKNPENIETADHKVRHPVREKVHDPARYPQFEDFMLWLRSGEMPARPWNHGKPSPASLYSNAGAETPFFRIERAIMKGGKIHTAGEWKQFCNAMTPAQDTEMRGYFEKIKKSLKTLGIIGDDRGVLKLDENDTPLTFYQEGASIITAEEFIRQCHARITDTPDYALAFGGAANAGASKMEQIYGSQLAGVAAFARPGDLPAQTRHSAVVGGGMSEDMENILQLIKEHHTRNFTRPDAPTHWVSRSADSRSQGFIRLI